MTSAFHRLGSGPERERRLIALPYAGGGAHIYHRLAGHLTNVELWAGEYPGHATRLREPPIDDIHELVATLLSDIEPLLDRSCVVLGYSMGALVAFELLQRLAPLPRSVRGLVACAAQSPLLPRDDDEKVEDMDDARFSLHVAERGGTPKEVLQHPELMELVLPALRADFVACERYRPSRTERLHLPVIAFRGARDLDLTHEDVDAWRAVSRPDDFSHHVLEGTHFFLQEPSAGFPQALGAALTSLFEEGSQAEHDATSA